MRALCRQTRVYTLNQPGRWKAILPNALYSPKCLEGVFCKVELSLLLGVCGLFFLDDLQSLDHLEGEAHYATLLALVLEVDCLVIVVDEDLRHKLAVVVEPLRPLWDIFVLYLFRLLAHRHALLSSEALVRPGGPKDRSRAVGAVLRGCVTRPPAKGADPKGPKAGSMVRQEVSDLL